MVTSWTVNDTGGLFPQDYLLGKRMGASSKNMLGESLRARRDALNLSQRDIAKVAGTTAAAISHIERGIRRPSADLLGRIARALDCPVDDLLKGATPGAAENDTLIKQVAAAMRCLPPPLQKEVLDFCGYLKQRD